MDYHACWVSMPIGWVVALCVAALRYRSGVWKTKSVVKQEENAPAAAEA